MRILVDTQALLWWATERHRLSKAAASALEDPASELVLSLASAWELALKMDRLGLTGRFGAFLDQAQHALDLKYLPVELRHVEHSGSLPWHHRDPFDRILIAQALSRKPADLDGRSQDRALPGSGNLVRKRVL